MMATAVKKTISLSPELAEEVEKIACEERKSFSAVIQDSLRAARKERLKKEFYQLQGYWSRIAKEKGILTEEDLELQVDAGLRELDKGKGIPHEEIEKRMSKWLTK